jgi:hypothetical protein
MRSQVSLTRESVGLAVELLGELVRRCAQRSNDGRGLEALVKGFSKGWIVRNDFQRERGNLYVQIGF